MGALAPTIKNEAKMGGPTNVGLDLGPLAMCYVKEKGWIAEMLGPSSKHWKQLTREVKSKPESKGKNPIKVKREGPTPLQELDPNIKDLKRRKGKDDMQNTVGKKHLDGGVLLHGTVGDWGLPR